MLRSGFWLVLLALVATALNAWALWLNRQLLVQTPADYLYGAAVLIELLVLFLTARVFGAIGRSHRALREEAAARLEAAKAPATPAQPVVTAVTPLPPSESSPPAP